MTSAASSSEFERVLEVVRAQLLRLDLPGIDAPQIVPSSRLIEDLGMDSMKFVDLTFGLEAALGIREFPMQEWVDVQIGEGKSLSVESLVLACQHELAATSP